MSVLFYLLYCTVDHHNDPECCYYLHCPTYDYPVLPDKYNDEQNAQDYTNHYKNNATKKSELYLVMSTTFANLQNPENNMDTLNQTCKPNFLS